MSRNLFKRHSRATIARQNTTRHRLSFESLEERRLLDAEPFAPGEIIVGFEGDLVAEFRQEGPGRALQSAAARFGGFGLQQGEALVHRSVGPAGQDRFTTLWRLPPGKDVIEAARVLSQAAGVAYAEPNYLVSTATTPQIPNDPKFSSLWGMHNTGQNGGTVDADIDAPEAWGRHTGTGNVVVAVIDTGVNHGHSDLRANMWINPFEVAGNGVDDDGNGFVDDIHGADFVNNDGDPKDDNGHGTHVSGTIGASGNNGTGVTGVDWNVEIMGLKFLNSGGSGSTSDAIRAVDYATQMRERGVNVVLTSNSWGGGGFSQGLYDAIAASGGAGMLFVAAAGNNGGSSASFPAFYNLDNIISVAATDRNDQLASFSNRGAGVDIAAPGVDVYSTYNNTYKTLSGTSMATPHVSGAAALVADYLATEGITPSYQDVRDAVLQSGDQIAATQTTVSTGSRLNVHGALLHAAVLAGNATGLSIGDASVIEGDEGSTTVAVTVTRSGKLDTTTELDWTTVGGAAIAGADFDAASGQLTFLPGETSQEILVTVLGDTAMEPEESFKVVLSNASNSPSDVDLSVLRGRANVAILNDDLGLVSSWTADGTTADAEGRNDSTLVSGATYDAGQIGQAFSFDGIDDRVQVADSESLKLTRSLTIEGWVRVDSVSSTRNGQILFRGDDRGGLDPYALSVNTNGALRFLVTPESNSGTSIGTPAPIGQFFHVAATLDDATGAMRLYVNGVTMAETVTTARPFRDLNPASNPGIGIGNHGGYPTTPHNFPFHGLIDALKVYNFALPAEQVLENFNSGKGDLQPAISIDDATVIEGDQSDAAFKVTLSAPSPTPVSLSFATQDGSAIAGSDYVTTAGTLMFVPGELTKIIAVPVVDDSLGEPEESFSVVLSDAAGATISRSQGTGTILDAVGVVSYASSDVPKQIRDLSTVTSTITVPEAAALLDIDVELNITHTWDGDLTAFLVGPDGTRVQLFARVGGSGDNFIGTILDDEAGASIISGSAPFTGRFRSQGLLSAFDGKSSAGVWTLELTDDFRQDKGTLNSWSIHVSRGISEASSSVAATLLRVDSSAGDPQTRQTNYRDAVDVALTIEEHGTSWTARRLARAVGSLAAPL